MSVTNLMDQVKTWKAPQPRIGTPVMFYPDADTGKEPSFGFLVEVFHKTVSIMLMTRGGYIIKREVNHKDDPELKLSPDRRSSGAWEETPDVRLLYELAERVARLENGSNETNPVAQFPVAKKTRRGNGDALRRWREQKKQAALAQAVEQG